MPVEQSPSADWPTYLTLAFETLAEPLLREVSDALTKPRNKLPADELVPKCVSALANPPVLDRRVAELSPAGQAVLALFGRSRQPVWKAGHVMALASALGYAEGTKTVFDLLTSGLVVPFVKENDKQITDWASWYANSGGVRAKIVLVPSVALRSRGLPLPVQKPATVPFGPAVPEVDGLDWPLRLAALWQKVGEEPVRTTQAGQLFKKDKTRFETEDMVSGPFGAYALTETVSFALAFAEAAGMLGREQDRFVTTPLNADWQGDRTPLLIQLFASLFHIETADPVAGVPAELLALPPFPTALLAALTVLAAVPEGQATTPGAIASWLWEHHPGWQALLPKDATKDQGTPWVHTVFRTIAEPLKIVEWSATGEAVRLAALGRHLFHDAPLPAAEPPFPQTLLVQPNSEILAYRQGLTPPLVAMLTRFAQWKQIGPACTLELSQGQVHRGLESGLSTAEILQTLSRHSTRPIPPAVDDLLRRWATKRERITVYPSATLVEFNTPMDLDSALARGIVSIRLNDRLALTADGAEPDYKHLRLTGNRDYESRPIPCMTVERDGMTMEIDVAQADLLLDVELAKFAVPVTTDPSGIRRFTMVPEKVRQATTEGMTAEAWDEWFQLRTNHPTPHATKLFAFGPDARASQAEKLIVVRFSATEIADGACQWPASADLVSDRLGPTAVAVDAENLEAFVNALKTIGVTVEVMV